MKNVRLSSFVLLAGLFLLGCKEDKAPAPGSNEPAEFPSGFAATATGTTSIDVTWADVSGVEKYIILAKTGTGVFAVVSDSAYVTDDADWSNNNAAKNVATGVQSHTFTDLSPNTSYSFIIYPYNETGAVKPDYKTDGTVPEVSAATLATPGEPPTHATAFTATAASATAINVTWTDASGASKYLVLAKTGAGTYYSVADGTAIADDTDWTNNNGALNVAQGVQAVSFTGLTASTSYSFQIFPYTEGGTPSPNFKIDGTIPTASVSTLASGTTPGLDPSLLSITTITVTGTPYNVMTDANNFKVHPQPSDVFIYSPRIILVPKASGESVVAWHDATAKIIKLTFLTAADAKTGVDVDLVTGSEGMGGFALNGTDFVVGFSSGTQKEKFTVRSYSSSYVQGFSTDLTGLAPLANVGTKQSPLKFGSGRIQVDPTGPRIGVFISHEMIWPDLNLHQGGLLKFLDNTGAIIGGLGANGDDAAGGSNWLYSHCLDNRLVVKGGKWAVTSNGDAVPRAIPFRTITNNVKTDVTSLFTIDGSIGDNDTKTQLGGFVARDDGTYALTFSTAVGRPARDVYFMKLSSAGAVQVQKFLTSYTSPALGYAINVKSANYGSNILLAWEETSTGTPTVFKAMFAVVNANGDIVQGPVQFPNARFNRGDDFVNFSNGDVGWVTGESGKLKIHRVRL